MLDHLRQRIIDLLEPTSAITLSSHGPAGIQAQMLPSFAVGLRLFVIVPATSEHLFNLELEPDVVATTANWQLRGYGRPLSPSELPPNFPLPSTIQATDYTVVEITPVQIEIGRPIGSGFIETIDIDDTST